MFKKLCILLIFSKLKVAKLLIDKYRMHNLYAIFAKLLNICKQIAGNLVNESGNVPRRGVVPKFSDLEVVALNMASEAAPYCNQKEWKPTFPAFAKARKRIETIFSQLCDQFMIIRNYAKDTDGLFARIIGKISALTILQYINYKNEKPIGRVKYELF